MIANMNANGIITLKAETQLEAYALRKWAESAYVGQSNIKTCEPGHWRSSALMVDASAPGEQS